MYLTIMTKDIAHIGSLKHSTPRFTSDIVSVNIGSFIWLSSHSNAARVPFSPKVPSSLAEKKKPLQTRCQGTPCVTDVHAQQFMNYFMRNEIDNCSGKYRYWYRYWNSTLTSQIKRVKKNCKDPCKRSQHCLAQLVANVCTPCYVFLRVVATCWKLLDEV